MTKQPTATITLVATTSHLRNSTPPVFYEPAKESNMTSGSLSELAKKTAELVFDFLKNKSYERSKLTLTATIVTFEVPRLFQFTMTTKLPNNLNLSNIYEGFNGHTVSNMIDSCTEIANLGDDATKEAFWSAYGVRMDQLCRAAVAQREAAK